MSQALSLDVQPGHCTTLPVSLTDGCLHLNFSITAAGDSAAPRAGIPERAGEADLRRNSLYDLYCCGSQDYLGAAAEHGWGDSRGPPGVWGVRRHPAAAAAHGLYQASMQLELISYCHQTNEKWHTA